MTHREKILHLFDDGNWHSYQELNEIAFRYSARIRELRESGHKIEGPKKFPGSDVNWYRLTKGDNENPN